MRRERVEGNEINKFMIDFGGYVWKALAVLIELFS